jgi:DNA-binding NarL/FixJ family response regulator
MGRRIPDPIRQQAIKKWLEGKSRDEIAQELKISQGAVSGIIKESGKDDPQFYL